MSRKKKKVEYPFITEPTIVLRNSGTVIRPFQPGGDGRKYSYIENITSYYDEVTHKRVPVNGFPLSCKDDTGEWMFVCDKKMPSMMASCYPDYTIMIDDPWHYYNMYPGIINMIDDFCPSEMQIDIIDRYNALANKTSVFINMPTASGKTVTGIYLAAAFGKRTLITCYKKKDVLEQWKRSFLRFTTLDEDQIVIIHDRAHFKRLVDEMKEPGYIYGGPSVVLCTTITLHSIIHNDGPDVFTDMMKTMGFGLKIMDEAHRHLATLTKVNALSNIPRSIYMSAEFRRANALMSKYFYSTFFSTNLLRPDDQFLEDFKYTTGVIVEYNSFPTQLEIDGCFTNRGFGEFLFMRYQFQKGAIINALDKLTKKLVDADNGKIIIFVSLVEHVDFLFSHFVPLYGHDRKIARLHGKVDDTERELVMSSADFIIGTYKSLDTGTDIKNVKHIISTGPVDVICDNQAAGRSRPMEDGSNAFYYILSDVGFKYVKKKTKERVQSLQDRKLVDLYKITIGGD